MNIELKPIAESKVRQLGGDVCGVLVRTEDSEVMAVSEHGRCTRLDAGVMGPVDGAQGGQGAEPIGFIPYSGLNNLAAGHPAKIYPVDATPSPFESHEMLYTQPQPAQQSNQEDVVALLTNALANIRDTAASAKTLQSMAALALRAAKEGE